MVLGIRASVSEFLMMALSEGAIAIVGNGPWT